MDGGRELLLSENIWGTEIWLNILSEEEKTGHLDPVELHLKVIYNFFISEKRQLKDQDVSWRR